MAAAANTLSLAGCKPLPRGVLGRARISFNASAGGRVSHQRESQQRFALARLAYSPAGQDRTDDRDHPAPREDDRNELIEGGSPVPDPEEVDPVSDDEDPGAD